MNAKEMFEKLGYKVLVNNKNTLEYLKQTEDEKYTITFDKKYKFIGHYYEQYSKFNNMWTYELCDLTLEELQAINKQVEELGWLDER